MWTVQRLVKTIGHPIRAEAVLLDHYAAKCNARFNWDRRYAVMDFVTRWAPIFRRHLVSHC